MSNEYKAVTDKNTFNIKTKEDGGYWTATCAYILSPDGRLLRAPGAEINTDGESHNELIYKHGSGTTEEKALNEIRQWLKEKFQFDGELKKQ